jgi:hypothetical protein
LEPCGEAESTRNGVDFAEGKAIFGDDEVGTDEVGQVVVDASVAGGTDEGLGFSGVEELRNLWDGFTLPAELVEVVEGFLEDM